MELILYHTSGCHLCELAEALVADAVAAGADIRLTRVDIANSQALVDRYGWSIPVLVKEQAELCWPFDLVQLQTWLN